MKYSILWNSFNIKDEKILKWLSATKFNPHRKYNPYEKIQGLTSIRGRLVRGDASQCFKIENTLNTVKFPLPNIMTFSIFLVGSIRRNRLKMDRKLVKGCDKKKISSHTDLRLYEIACGEVNSRNTNQFKINYDNFIETRNK